VELLNWTNSCGWNILAIVAEIQRFSQSIPGDFIFPKVERPYAGGLGI
jgi:hypothetical protein